MNFRDRLRLDAQKVFFNPLQFAELHVWQNDPTNPDTARTIPMIIESFTLDGKPLPAFEGVSVHRATVHLPHDNLGYTPGYSDWIKLDGREFIVKGVGNEFGVLRVMIEANHSV